MKRYVAAVTVLLIWMGMLAPATDTTVAQSRASRTIFLDPGHGGSDNGAIRIGATGIVELREKDVNLDIAVKTAELLRERGYRVILSRTTDERSGEDSDVNGDGRITKRDPLQSVVDAANESDADLFLGLHSNASWDTAASGVEVYYCADRPFASENRRLAELVRVNLLQSLAGIGYYAQDRGIKEDSVLYQWRSRRGRGHLFVLGPTRSWGGRSVHPRATEMPGVLAEALFVTNSYDAAILRSERGQWAIARGYVAAIDAYFGSR